MRRVLVGVTTCLLLASSVAAPAAADDGGRFERPAGLRRTPVRLPVALNPTARINVIVELAGQPVAQREAAAQRAGRSLSAAERRSISAGLRRSQAPLIARARALGGNLRFTYQASFNGFSLAIPRNRVERLAALPGVVDLHAVREVTLDNERSVPFIGSASAWHDLGLTGAGVKIGVIDTGIDYYHASFGGSGDPADFAGDDGLTIGTAAFPNVKVAGGWDFVGDEYDASLGLAPRPDGDPLDCYGHGSHVAGTAAGYGVLNDGSTYSGGYEAADLSGLDWRIGPGVAPEATLYAYRIFGCDGSSDSDVIVAAIDRAVSDGVDIINMSLGSPFGRAGEPDAVAANNASLAGVLVVAASGNSGHGAYITASPAVASRALSVAAIDGGYASIPTAAIDLADVGTLINANDGGLPVSGELLVLRDGAAISLGCDESDYAGAAGKVVVTVRGDCARVDRAIFADAAGAAAVIMINNDDGLPPFEGPIPGVAIPFLGAAADAYDALLAADGASQTISAGGSQPSAGYRHAAPFSSAGPRIGDSAAKPDVAAPGLATVSAAVGTGSFGQAMSGTSMATPHVAGVAALVAQANPAWSPAAIKAAIVNTSSFDPALVEADSVDSRVLGAGVVQPALAASTIAYATTMSGDSSFSFGYRALGGAWRGTRTMRIHNTDTVARSFSLSAALQNGLGARISFSRTSVTVPAGGHADVKLTLRLGRAAVRDLPAADQAPGQLSTLRAFVVATPTAAAAGLHPLRVPILLVPRGLARMSASTTTLDFRPRRSTRSATFTNVGVHQGDLDVYAWGGSSPRRSKKGAIDLRAAGVQSLPGEAVGAPGDRLLVFAVNGWSRWSTAAANEYDVLISSDSDSAAEFLVAGVDLGWLFEGEFNGEMAAATFDLRTGALVDVWYAIAPMNGSTLLLPVLASPMGITSARPRFAYWAESYQVFDSPGWRVDWTGTSRFDAFTPPVANGAFVPLAPGARATLPFTINRSVASLGSQKGWMVVTLDGNRSGTQALLIRLVR